MEESPKTHKSYNCHFFLGVYFGFLFSVYKTLKDPITKFINGDFYTYFFLDT
jgi:hypothetical protein